MQELSAAFGQREHVSGIHERYPLEHLCDIAKKVLDDSAELQHSAQNTVRLLIGEDNRGMPVRSERPEQSGNFVVVMMDRLCGIQENLTGVRHHLDRLHNYTPDGNVARG